MRRVFKLMSIFLLFSIFTIMLSGCSNMKMTINGEGSTIDKDVFLKQNEKYYVDIKKFLDERGFENLSLEDTNTYIINPKQIVSIDTKAMLLIINGEEIELKDLDYLEKNGQVYINLDLYCNLFEEKISIDSEGESIDIKPKFNYLTSDDITLYDYFTGNYDKNNFGKRYNENYGEDLKDSKVKILSDEEAGENTSISRINGVNEKILKGYNSVTTFYDTFNQFQVYNWDIAVDKTNIMGGYGLVMNITSILDNVIDLSVINEINTIDEFTLKDIEYINRINTILSAIPSTYISNMGNVITNFSNKLFYYQDGGNGIKDIYNDAVVEAEKKYRKAFSTYVNLKLPSFSAPLPIVNKMKDIKNIKNSKDMESESEKVLKELFDWIENNPYEALKDKKSDLNDFIEKLPEQWQKKLEPLKEDLVMQLPSLVELVDKKGSINIDEFTKTLDNLNSSYNDMIEAVGVANNLFTIFEKTDYENYNFANSIDTGRAKAFLGLMDTALGSGMTSIFGASYLSLSLLEDISDNIERLTNTVGGLVIMALSDEVYDIDDVFNKKMSIEEYINQ